MKSTLAIALLFAAGYLTPVATAHAQSVRMQAHVPFNFSSADKSLPAGIYEVTIDGRTPFITVSDRSTHHVMLLGRSGDEATGTGNKLVFHKYGNRYFLSAIHGRHGSPSMQLPVTKAEKRAQLETVEAGLRIEDPVLVAMN